MAAAIAAAAVLVIPSMCEHLVRRGHNQRVALVAPCHAHTATLPNPAAAAAATTAAAAAVAAAAAHTAALVVPSECEHLVWCGHHQCITLVSSCHGCVSVMHEVAVHDIFILR